MAATRRADGLGCAVTFNLRGLVVALVALPAYARLAIAPDARYTALHNNPRRR